MIGWNGDDKDKYCPVGRDTQGSSKGAKYKVTELWASTASLCVRKSRKRL